LSSKCFLGRDHRNSSNFIRDEARRIAANIAKLLTKDKALRIAANVAKLPELLQTTK
jgi:hypothetical protein